MHKIGIISDTHSMLRPEVLEVLRECELILQGGDINRQEILDELSRIAPVYAVRGNNDFYSRGFDRNCSCNIWTFSQV